MGELPQLLNALRGDDAEGRRRALEQLARFDPPSYLPAFAERFPFLCNDWSLQVREAFVARMHALGPAAGTPALLAAAVSVLDCSSEWRKLSALRAIRYLGPPAAHRGLFDRLAGLFCGTSEILARAAGAVLRNVGPLAARPVVLARLRELLDREASEDREFALEILAGFGAVPLPPGLPGRIAYLWVREAGASGRSGCTRAASVAV